MSETVGVSEASAEREERVNGVRARTELASRLEREAREDRRSGRHDKADVLERRAADIRQRIADGY